MNAGHRARGPIPVAWDVAITPPLPDDAGEHAQPELVFERRRPVAPRDRFQPAGELRPARSEQVAGHAGDMWSLGEIERRLLRRFHVEAVLPIENRAAD